MGSDDTETDKDPLCQQLSQKSRSTRGIDYIQGPSETTPNKPDALRKRVTIESRNVHSLMADATQKYMDFGKLEKDVESRRLQIARIQLPTFRDSRCLPSQPRECHGHL